MNIDVDIRPVRREDYSGWRPLWDGYNAFYGRVAATALSENITECTWERFFNPIEPVFALIAEKSGTIIGLVHYLFHRSTTMMEPVCYLQDIFTDPLLRGRGVGRKLIESVYMQAWQAGARRVYWQTQESNQPGRALYDKVANHLGFIVYTRELHGE